MEEEINPNQNIGVNINFEDIFRYNYNSNKEWENTKQLYKENCKNLDHLSKILNVDDLKTGLNSRNEPDIEWRKKRFGENKVIYHPKVSLVSILQKELFKTNFSPIILGLSLFQMIIGILSTGNKKGCIEGLLVFIFYFISTSVHSYLEYIKTKEGYKLEDEKKSKSVFVIRNNLNIRLLSDELLVGDIMRISPGDIIQADGILVEGSLLMDESNLLNERKGYVKKKKDFIETANEIIASPLVFSGSKCIEGSATVLVVAVGKKSFKERNLFNSIERELENEQEENKKNKGMKYDSPLKEISEFSEKFKIFLLSFVIGFLLFLKEIYFLLFEDTSILSLIFLNKLITIALITFVLFSISYSSNLNALINLCFYRIVYMSKKEIGGVEIKSLDKLSKLGYIDEVLINKTGFISSLMMNVENFFILDNIYSPNNKKDYPIKDVVKFKKVIQDYMPMSIVYNEYSKYAKDRSLMNFNNPIEKAFVNFLQKEKYVLDNENVIIDKTLDDLIKDTLYKEERKTSSINSMKNERFILDFSPFNNFTAYIHQKDNDKYGIFIKGSPEVIGEFCTDYLYDINLNQNKEEIKKYSEVKDKIEQTVNECSAHSLTSVCFAYKEVCYEEIRKLKEDPKIDSGEFFKDICKGSKFLFIVGLKNEIQEGAIEALNELKKEKITTRLITRENLTTALSLSEGIGLLNITQIKKVRKTINELKTLKERINPDNIDDLINKINSLEIYALEGKLFKEILSLYTDPKEEDYKELFKALTKNLKIISRAEPEVKLLFLEGLKKLEKSVAVTGRLVTDEKYLKKANVGFSLELRGNDITKEASDIILLSDSLDGILMSYKYSKMFYNKLRILLLFYVPFISVLNIFMFFGIFLLRENTFTPLKILWINIAFSYFIMPILTNVLKSKKIKLYKLTKPNGKIPLINSQLIISMIFQFLHQLFFLILMIWVGDMILGIVPSNININTVSQKDIKDLGGYNITVIFNVFVYMQIFSFISANGVINTLFDFNSIVGILWLIGGQIIIGFLGEKYFDIKVIGLKDHFICLFISSLSLPVNFISSIFPIEDKIEEEKVKKDKHPLGKEKVE